MIKRMGLADAGWRVVRSPHRPFPCHSNPSLSGDCVSTAQTPSNSQTDLQLLGSKQTPQAIKVSGMQVPQMSAGLRAASLGSWKVGRRSRTGGLWGGQTDNLWTHHRLIYGLRSQEELLG